jgi:hypothetical protein
MELTDEQRAAIRDTVDALMVDFWGAWRQADFDHGLAFFHDAPETAWALGGWQDPKTILTCYQQTDSESMRQALAQRF